MFSNALTNVINALYAVNVLGIPKEQWFLTYIPLLAVMIVASLPIGKIVDKLGTKIPLMLGQVVLASGLWLFVHGNFYTVMVAMALLGMVHLLVMSSGMALSASLVEPENRGKVRGCLNFMGYVFTGLGMFLCNFLYNLKPQLPFYVTIGLAFPMLLILLFRIQEPKKQQ